MKVSVFVTIHNEYVVKNMQMCACGAAGLIKMKYNLIEYEIGFYNSAWSF